MDGLVKTYGILVLVGIFLISCKSEISSSENNRGAETHATKANGNKSAGTLNICEDAGNTGMTAVYVNESVKNAVIDYDNHNCDMAIYFDENAPKNAFVRNTTVIQETGNSGEVYGLWNNGADVIVTKSEFTTVFSGQFLPIRFDEGAQGTISSNKISGTHRVAILVRGADTDVAIKGNVINGSGAKTDNWAENGIQVDQGATAKVMNNEIRGHWWDGESNFASAGLLMFNTANSTVTNNIFNDNEFSLYVSGTDNKVTGNRSTSEIESQSSFEFKAWGILLNGSDNHLAGNKLSSMEGTGEVGIYIYPASSYNKITGNRINGFTVPVIDGGNESMIRGTPAPPQGI